MTAGSLALCYSSKDTSSSTSSPTQQGSGTDTDLAAVTEPSRIYCPHPRPHGHSGRPLPRWAAFWKRASRGFGGRGSAQSHWTFHGSGLSTKSRRLKSLPGPRWTESSGEQTEEQAPPRGRPPPVTTTETGAGQRSAVPHKSWVLGVIRCSGSEATERSQCSGVTLKVTRAATIRQR